MFSLVIITPSLSPSNQCTPLSLLVKTNGFYLFNSFVFHYHPPMLRKSCLNGQIKTGIKIVFTPITWIAEGLLLLLLFFFLFFFFSSLRMQKSDMLKALEIGNFYLTTSFVRVKINWLLFLAPR